MIFPACFAKSTAKSRISLRSTLDMFDDHCVQMRTSKAKVFFKHFPFDHSLSLMTSNPNSNGINNTKPSISSKADPPLITLIRHPQTLANQAHLLQGSTDSDLSPLGQSQLEALRDNWSSLHKDQVTLIISSPLGRTVKLAEALQGAVFQRKDEPLTSISDSPSTNNIVFRDGLKEIDFGGLESSRKGKYVPGFPKGNGSGETKDRFTKRVKEEAQFLLEVASGKRSLDQVTTLDAGAEQSRRESSKIVEVNGKGKRKFQDDQSRSTLEASPLKKQFNQSIDLQYEPLTLNSNQSETTKGNYFLPESSSSTSIQSQVSSSSSPSQQSSNLASISISSSYLKPRTHILIITHGLWLSTFFKLHNLNLPFASNTGVYTLSVHHEIPKSTFCTNPKEKLSLKVLKANDVRHLAGLAGTSSSGKSKDKFAVVGSDPRQKKLEVFFKPKGSN